MEPEASLQHSRESVTSHKPEPDQSSPCPVTLLEDPIFPSTSRSSKWSVCLRFSHRTPVCTYPLPIMSYIVPSISFFLTWSP